MFLLALFECVVKTNACRTWWLQIMILVSGKNLNLDKPRFRWNYTHHTHTHTHTHTYIYILVHQTQDSSQKKLTHHSNNNCPMTTFSISQYMYTKALLTINAICILLVQIHGKNKKFLINHILYNVQHKSSVNFWQQQLQSISVSLYSPSALQNIQIFALELCYILISAVKCL
jgi:hypothetical protein